MSLIQPSTSYVNNQSFAVLLMGPPKSGKTCCAMQFPTPFFADCDNNLLSAKAMFPQKEFFYCTINKDEQNKEIPKAKRWDRLVKVLNEAMASDKIKTIVVDSLTYVNEYIKDNLLALPSSQRAESFMLSRSEYIKFYNVLIELVVTLRSSNKIIVFTSHDSLEKDENTGAMYIRPSVVGQAQDKLPSFFSDVWHCESKSTNNKDYKYFVRTKKTNQLISLGSFLDLPAEYDFTWEDLNKRMTERGIVV